MDDTNIENTLQAIGSTILSNVVYSTLNQKSNDSLNNTTLDDEFDDNVDYSDTGDEDDGGITTSRTIITTTSTTTDNIKSVPFVINCFLNLITTLALSLAIYLLMTNSFLFLHKLQLDNFILESELASSLNLRYQQHNQPHQQQQQKYDCGFNQQLTAEECKQLNRYEMIINKFKEEIKQFSASTGSIDDGDMIRVNTSMFVY